MRHRAYYWENSMYDAIKLGLGSSLGFPGGRLTFFGLGRMFFGIGGIAGGFLALEDHLSQQSPVDGHHGLAIIGTVQKRIHGSVEITRSRFRVRNGRGFGVE